MHSFHFFLLTSYDAHHLRPTVARSVSTVWASKTTAIPICEKSIKNEKCCKKHKKWEMKKVWNIAKKKQKWAEIIFVKILATKNFGRVAIASTEKCFPMTHPQSTIVFRTGSASDGRNSIGEKTVFLGWKDFLRLVERKMAIFSEDIK